MMNAVISHNIEQFVKVIKSELLPFENFVARKYEKDQVDINQPHNLIDIKIMRAIRNISINHIPKCIPLLGKSGAGKTHYFWVLKDMEQKNEQDYSEAVKEQEKSLEYTDDDFNSNLTSLDFLRWRCVYIPSPPAPIRIPLHILTCLFDELGEEILENVSFNIIKRFGKSTNRAGKKDKKYFNKLMAKGLSYFGGMYSDILKAFVIYGSELNSDLKNLAQRWLFGEILSSDELNKLSVRTNIENDDTCFALIKLVGEMFSFPIIFFFDEMELLYRIHGKEAEIRVWEIIKKLFNESHNILFITTCLLDVWDRVENTLDLSVLSRFDPILRLRPFTFENIVDYYSKSMKLFWETHINSYPEDMLFPFSINTLEDIFTKSGGNQRTNIKLINMTFQKFIDGEFSLDLISNSKWSVMDENEKIIPKKLQNSNISEINGAIQELESNIIPALNKRDTQNLDIIFGSENDHDTERKENKYNTSEIGTLLPVTEILEEICEDNIKLIIDDDVYYFDIGPNVMYYTIASILKHFSTYTGKFHEIEMDPKITVNKTAKTLGIIYHLVEKDEPSQIGIEIPQCKNFKYGSSMASKNLISSYHSLIKLTEIIKRGIIDKGILLIPKNALVKGKQISKLLSNYESELLIIELSNTSARNFIIKWNETENKINHGDNGSFKKFIYNNEIAQKILGFFDEEIEAIIKGRST